jgi:glycosyltransferase involved in cell wall biosynthesis
VFDFDDAIFYRPPKWGGRGAAMPVDVNFVRIMALADVVFAGNAYLAQHASEYSGNVMVLPTVVDPAYYTVDHGRSTREGPVVIGWIGSPTTLFYVERLAAVFRQLAGEYDYTLKIIGARGAAIPGVKVVCEDWSLENEREQLASIDIGIAPLDDSEWSRGKCGLKILVYMASGVPVAASPYGVNGEIIRDGENGLLAVSDDEWREKLTALMLDRELRARLAQEGRKTVEANYSLPAAAAELAAFLKELNNK